MDVDALRESTISIHKLKNVDDVYTFYYDETNNVRKFHIIEDGFNVTDPGNFVLAGVLHKGLSKDIDYGPLFHSLNLQATAKELKRKAYRKRRLRIDSCIKKNRQDTSVAN